ncbi:hypothetical protein [Rhizobium sp.]
MKRYLLRIGNDNVLIRSIEAKSLNHAVSQALIGLALFLPPNDTAPEEVRIVVMDTMQRVLATIMLSVA